MVETKKYHQLQENEKCLQKKTESMERVYEDIEREKVEWRKWDGMRNISKMLKRLSADTQSLSTKSTITNLLRFRAKGLFVSNYNGLDNNHRGTIKASISVF
jgi:hypothetical protein